MRGVCVDEQHVHMHVCVRDTVFFIIAQVVNKHTTAITTQ